MKKRKKVKLLVNFTTTLDKINTPWTMILGILLAVRNDGKGKLMCVYGTQGFTMGILRRIVRGCSVWPLERKASTCSTRARVTVLRR